MQNNLRKTFTTLQVQCRDKFLDFTLTVECYDYYAHAGGDHRHQTRNHSAFDVADLADNEVQQLFVSI